jgi:hypothetical protein
MCAAAHPYTVPKCPRMIPVACAPPGTAHRNPTRSVACAGRKGGRDAPATSRLSRRPLPATRTNLCSLVFSRREGSGLTSGGVWSVAGHRDSAPKCSSQPGASCYTRGYTQVTHEAARTSPPASLHAWKARTSWNMTSSETMGMPLAVACLRLLHPTSPWSFRMCVVCQRTPRANQRSDRPEQRVASFNNLNGEVDSSKVYVSKDSAVQLGLTHQRGAVGVDSSPCSLYLKW